MNCAKIIDMIYKEDSVSFFNQIQIDFHAYFCSACAQEIEHYKAARNVMREDFFPFSPNLENSIIAKLHLEQIDEEQLEAPNNIPGTLSTRSWVIAGLILMTSLITVFLGMDFQNLASESGMSFMLPMGITIGIVLTTYGAFFIGSHLKELSERFGL